MAQQKAPFQPVALALILGAALLRLAPHPPNFSPVGGVALFGGARLRGWQAYLVPLLAMLITDPILSHMAGYPAYSPATLLIYTSFFISVLLGRVFLRDSVSLWKIGAVTLAASVQFYLLTNFPSWWSGSLYPHTGAGLAECYIAGLPFFGLTVVGDLFYAAVLFSAYGWATRRLPREAATPPQSRAI